jgi:LacI family transcriptional regulator
MQERTKYTMRDVARLAGVSTSTVSAVINGVTPVSPQRKKKVIEAMTALDYHPDVIARSLKTGKTNAVGVIVPDITNAFYPEVVRGVEAAAQLSGYSVLLCDSSEDPQIEARHLAALFSRRVDGVLLACCANSTAYDAMIRRRFPMVFVDRLPSAVTEWTVSTDNVDAGYIAAKHLIGMGHERIAMVVGNLELSPHRDRLEGFRRAMQESHLPIIEQYLMCGDVEIGDSLAAGHRLMSLPVLPTALMVSNNKLLLGILQALEERRIEVPSRLSLLGFDDQVWNRHFNPPLTAVAQATHEMGKRSFDLLLQIISDQEIPDSAMERNIRLPAELRIRDSTAPPRQEH